MAAFDGEQEKVINRIVADLKSEIESLSKKLSVIEACIVDIELKLDNHIDNSNMYLGED